MLCTKYKAASHLSMHDVVKMLEEIASKSNMEIDISKDGGDIEGSHDIYVYIRN